MRASLIRSRLQQGLPARIAALYYPTAMMPAHAARAGFDALWLDAEHNTWDRREIQRLAALHHLANIDCLVRTGSRNANELYHLLEDGVTALMIPLVDTAEDAAHLAAAVKFPPLGQRGLDGASLDNNFYLGAADKYPAAANTETFLILQIETPEALANLDQIAGTPGVDGLFLGPGDLSIRLDCPMDWSHPKMTGAEDAVAAAAARHRIAWGRPAGNVEQIARIVRKGGKLIAHGSDFGAIMTMLPVYAKNLSDGIARS
ncbi:aldolase/citrate lyase family protein [Opitutus sp. GAS368]|uniref:HpcH/HpaI aldolase family protein n=1 Tax=Opitutus sp. GAS368 TaxID=1882749 RepID=UPI000879987B|nr:aldolase/citrate lyase family protein [Opitutus sp. GAS368]SDS49069.1 2-dehydro-3-deoxyglucarate aldolase/4-hydroxy-2-oxoheptanedioate aldolase [Opitutus sp. GAS368]